METKLARISQLSKENPDMVFTSLGHLLNKEMLKSCHAQMDGTKAVGIDGITKYSKVRPHKEKINISKEIIKKTRGAVAPCAARMNHTPLRGEQQATVL